MLFSPATNFVKNKYIFQRCTTLFLKTSSYSHAANIENKYSEDQKQKILEVMNCSNDDELSSYDITKARLKKFSQWKLTNGQVKTIADVEYIDGFTERTAKKLFDSILEGAKESSTKLNTRLKGQILHPTLDENVRNNCETILSVYINVNSVCWALIEKSNYEVTEWKYYSINYPESKKMQITDILDIAWDIISKLPTASIYVMKAEPTTLRAGGSDPNNPKVLAVNLQKSQMVAMIVALINARSKNCQSFDSYDDCQPESSDKLKHVVYFLRPSLPYRLYGTLVGNEKVSTDQTVDVLLNDITTKTEGHKKVYMSDKLKDMFRSQTELRKDMLGHCLLLGLTFMDLCIYKNHESILKLTRRQ